MAWAKKVTVPITGTIIWLDSAQYVAVSNNWTWDVFIWFGCATLATWEWICVKKDTTQDFDCAWYIWQIAAITDATADIWINYV